MFLLIKRQRNQARPIDFPESDKASRRGDATTLASVGEGRTVAIESGRAVIGAVSVGFLPIVAAVVVIVFGFVG